MIGVRADGRKELIALADGYRESTESWASSSSQPRITGDRSTHPTWSPGPRRSRLQQRSPDRAPRAGRGMTRVALRPATPADSEFCFHLHKASVPASSAHSSARPGRKAKISSLTCSPSTPAPRASTSDPAWPKQPGMATTTSRSPCGPPARAGKTVKTPDPQVLTIAPRLPNQHFRPAKTPGPGPLRNRPRPFPTKRALPSSYLA
jgi:hypothetical protein